MDRGEGRRRGGDPLTFKPPTWDVKVRRVPDWDNPNSCSQTQTFSGRRRKKKFCELVPEPVCGRSGATAGPPHADPYLIPLSCSRTVGSPHMTDKLNTHTHTHTHSKLSAKLKKKKRTGTESFSKIFMKWIWVSDDDERLSQKEKKKKNKEFSPPTARLLITDG